MPVTHVQEIDGGAPRAVTPEGTHDGRLARDSNSQSFFEHCDSHRSSEVTWRLTPASPSFTSSRPKKRNFQKQWAI